VRTDQYRRISPMSRRRFMLDTATIGGATLLSGGSAREAFAQDRQTTMVIAAPATPQSLDHEFDVSLGTIDSVGALYDNLLGYEKIADPDSPEARREDISVRTDKPYNLALTGKLAEKWELTDDGQVARFWLRQGVMSNWGNELTSEDVRWTWTRKLHLTGLGPFQTSVINIKQEDQIKAEGRYVVSFHSPKPSPLCSSRWSTSLTRSTTRPSARKSRAATIPGRASSCRMNPPASARTRYSRSCAASRRCLRDATTTISVRPT
jgi:peptide/nickel transport system substrate-binding protein